jgi:hypothetical protein
LLTWYQTLAPTKSPPRGDEIVLDLEVTIMRFRVRKFAHFLERTGLAMAGAACGLFVAAHVGSTIAAFTSQAFIVIMMVGGAVGFYLGIDTPPLPFAQHSQPSNGETNGKIDAAELLSASGTFLATVTAFVSVGIIVLRENPRLGWTIAIMAAWVLGVTMQILAGAIARLRN